MDGGRKQCAAIEAIETLSRRLIRRSYVQQSKKGVESNAQVSLAHPRFAAQGMGTCA
jgi:hypothetical protein